MIYGFTDAMSPGVAKICAQEKQNRHPRKELQSWRGFSTITLPASLKR